MSLIPRMADSIDPARIPNLYAQNPNGVLIYINGTWAWPQVQIDRFPRHQRISVTGGFGRHARWIDFERGDVINPEIVVQHVRDRREAGFRNGGPYCDRSNVPQVHKALEAAGLANETEWFIATLDGFPWSATQMHEHLLSFYKVDIPISQIRFIQNQPDNGGGYDVSRGFGNLDWDHH